jgi:hypothetical protein
MSEFQIGKLHLSTPPITRQFQSRFGELQKKWRRFTKDSVAREILVYLRELNTPTSVNTYHQGRGNAMNFVATPLLVWVLADTYTRREGAKAASRKDVIALLNVAWSLSECQETLETLTRNLNLAMRNIAIQQFEHQENLLRQDFARTWLIFTALAPNNRLRKSLEGATALSVEETLSLVLLFSLAFGSHSKSDSGGNQLSIAVLRAIEQCPKFLTSLCAFDGKDLRVSIALRHSPSSIYAPSPFVRYPLIQLQDGLHIVDNHLAGRTAELYGYRLAEEFGGPHEKQQLTQLTESYVNGRIKQSFGVNAHVAKEVPLIAGAGKTCDQVIRVSSNLILFVEIKAAQLSPKKFTSLSEDFLFSVLEQTLVKGYEQLSATKNRCGEMGFMSLNDQCISLVVTHENLRLSDGQALRELLPRLGEVFDTQKPKYKTSESEFFVCTIGEYDQLIDLHTSGKNKLQDFFCKVLLQNQTSGGRRFNISGYLSKDFLQHQPQHLEIARVEAFKAASNLLLRLTANSAPSVLASS